MPSNPTTLPELIAALEVEVECTREAAYEYLNTSEEYNDQADMMNDRADLMARAARVLQAVFDEEPMPKRTAHLTADELLRGEGYDAAIGDVRDAIARAMQAK